MNMTRKRSPRKKRLENGSHIIKFNWGSRILLMVTILMLISPLATCVAYQNTTKARENAIQSIQQRGVKLHSPLHTFQHDITDVNNTIKLDSHVKSENDDILLQQSLNVRENNQNETIATKEFNHISTENINHSEYIVNKNEPMSSNIMKINNNLTSENDKSSTEIILEAINNNVFGNKLKNDITTNQNVILASFNNNSCDNCLRQTKTKPEIIARVQQLKLVTGRYNGLRLKDEENFVNTETSTEELKLHNASPRNIVDAIVKLIVTKNDPPAENSQSKTLDQILNNEEGSDVSLNGAEYNNKHNNTHIIIYDNDLKKSNIDNVTNIIPFSGRENISESTNFNVTINNLNNSSIMLKETGYFSNKYTKNTNLSVIPLINGSMYIGAKYSIKSSKLINEDIKSSSSENVENTKGPKDIDIGQTKSNRIADSNYTKSEINITKNITVICDIGIVNKTCVDNDNNSKVDDSNENVNINSKINGSFKNDNNKSELIVSVNNSSISNKNSAKNSTKTKHNFVSNRSNVSNHKSLVKPKTAISRKNVTGVTLQKNKKETIKIKAAAESNESVTSEEEEYYVIDEEDQEKSDSMSKNMQEKGVTSAPIGAGALEALQVLAQGMLESVAERVVPRSLRDFVRRMQDQSTALETIRLRSKEENGGIGIFGRSILRSITDPLSQLMQGVRDHGALDSDGGFMAGVANGVTFVADSLAETFKDRLKAIYPGTLWCGDGDLARSAEVGLFFMTDSCCRKHDRCKMYIRAGTTKYGLTNTGIFTRSHCKCDKAFYRCLKQTNSLVASQVGVTYFTILSPQCFQKAHPIIRCAKKNRKCEEYEMDMSQPKMWQWFDTETF